MDSIHLATKCPDATDKINLERCIVCQGEELDKLTTNANGRKRIKDAASVRNDAVSKRLKLINDDVDFSYHMTNNCYKKYTMQKTIDKLSDINDMSQQGGGDCPSYQLRLSTASSKTRDPKEVSCIICDNIKHNGSKTKFRISETDCATKFLQAMKCLQDEVYFKTCYLEDVHSLISADLYYHDNCMKKYIRLYNKKVSDKSCQEYPREYTIKQRVWQIVMVEIESYMASGEGFELSVVRDSVNSKLSECGSSEQINNRDLKVMLQNQFGSKILFSYPHEANKSIMCFAADICNVESLAETIRNTDPIKDCANKLRNCLLEYNFGLEDRFCDVSDLRASWDDIVVPGPVLEFLKVLFKVDSIDTCSDVKMKRILSTFQCMFYNVHQGHKRTPLHVMNSVAIHNTCKSKTLITNFNRFGLCVSYNELMRIHHDLASFTVQSSENGLPLPSSFDAKKFTMAAFDNFDHIESTLSGNGSSHDTVAVVFQEKDGSNRRKPNVSETNIVHGPVAFDGRLNCQILNSFIKPAIKPLLPDDFHLMNEIQNKHIMYDEKKKDQIWALTRIDLEKSVNIKPSNQKVPSWSGVNSIWSSENIPVSQVSFLPLLPFPVTEYSTVYTELKNFNVMLSALNQTNLPVACDEGVYRIAREIQLLRPDEFKNIVLCMGSFHMTKVALGCIGKFLKDSGAQTIFVESTMFGPNVVESVLSGSNYVRSFKGMQCLKEALERLQLASFFKSSSSSNNYHKEISVIQDLKKSLTDRDTENSQKILKQLQEKTLNVIDDLNKFIEMSCDRCKTFKYWNTFLKMVTLVENLVRSDREGNWHLHIMTVEELLPIFAAFDATNYLRWCSLYLEDMKRLPSTAPDIHESFCDGKFVVKHTAGRYKAVGADMALEQTINRSQKSQSGIIGMTRQKAFVTKWELIYHEMLAVDNFHREVSGFNIEDEVELNHNVSDSETESGERNVQLLIDFILKHEDPFQTKFRMTELHNIITKEVVSDDVSVEILNMGKIGSDIYLKLRQERYIDKSRKVSDTIHRANIKGFHTMKKQRCEQRGKKDKRNESFNKQLLDITRERDIPMNIILQYDLSDDHFLFDKDGFMKKAQKSTLIQQLEKNLTTEDRKTNFKDQTLNIGVVFDVMAIFRKIKLRELKTFGNLCKAVIEYAKISSSFAQRIDFVFDSYDVHSIKDCERNRRSKQTPLELSEVLGNTLLPVDMNMFWASSKNKLKLQFLLHEEILVSIKNSQQVVASEIKQGKSCQSTTNGFVHEMPELHSQLQEADERILLHISNSLKNGINCVVVHSPDSDVIILLLCHFSHFQTNGLNQLWVKCGVGNSTRFMPIHIMAPQHGKLCSVLPAVHHLTGSDYTSKVGTKAAALKVNPQTFLSKFGHSVDEPELSKNVLKAESYLVQVIKPGTTAQTMNELRGHFYFHCKSVLPPTSKAIKPHILRACLATWNMLRVFEPHNASPDPTLFGYVLKDYFLVPVIGSNPLPETYTIRCRCKTCVRDSCACKQKSVLCTRFCNCSLQEEGMCRNFET